MGEDKLRTFGGKDDKVFWADKPIQKGHPKSGIDKEVKKAIVVALWIGTGIGFVLGLVFMYFILGL